MDEPEDRSDTRPHVLIVGAGFGGLAAARALRRALVRVTVIDRHNYHCFQPLLYQVATSGLSPGNIAPAIRWVLRRQANAQVAMARVDAIDLAKRCVRADGPAGEPVTLEYDWLVVAAGARHSYFGNDQWERHAPGLKSVDDAIDIRRRILTALERAELTADPELRRALMTFVVVGAGPTGVELAGQLGEMTRRTLRREFTHIDTADCRVLLVEGADRVLTAFDSRLSHAAERSLARLGVEVDLKAIVNGVDEHGVSIRHDGDDVEDRIAAHTVLWAAGNAGSGLARQLAEQTGADADRAGRVVPCPDLSLPGQPTVFAIGDMAATGAPAVAPAAIQQGEFVGSLIARECRLPSGGRSIGRPGYSYRDKGKLATIGRNHAVAEFGKLRISGRFAWVLWLTVHLAFIVGYANRAIVLFRWAVAYLTHNRGERALTDTTAPPLA